MDRLSEERLESMRRRWEGGVPIVGIVTPKEFGQLLAEVAALQGELAALRERPIKGWWHYIPNRCNHPAMAKACGAQGGTWTPLHEGTPES